MAQILKRTHQYKFRNPEVRELKELTRGIRYAESFIEKYGTIASLLHQEMESGLLEVLIQFFDPEHRCFTFPDYQLVPNLEQFSFILRTPVTRAVPYTRLEKDPKFSDIAKSIYLSEKEVKDNLRTRGKILGFPAAFLMEKARMYAEYMSTDAFEAISALLIYGLFLFPTLDHFVDMTAIKIFLIRNPAPTLLADVLYSMHRRTEKKGGTVLCCAPLLHRWYTFHLPRGFLENPLQLKWSQCIMALTHSDIDWYTRRLDGVEILDSCGEFPNVPLIGTKGAINYNPILARRQLGYPHVHQPKDNLLIPIIIQEDQEDASLRSRIAEAWTSPHFVKKGDIGKKDCKIWESYTYWVRKRAVHLKMPYPMELPHIHPVGPTAEEITMAEEIERLKDLLKEVTVDRDMWRTSSNYYRSLVPQEMLEGETSDVKRPRLWS